MPAGPVGTCWESGSWEATAWEADAWAGSDPGPGPEPDVADNTATRIAALYSASRIPFRPRR